MLAKNFLNDLNIQSIFYFKTKQKNLNFSQKEFEKNKDSRRNERFLEGKAMSKKVDIFFPSNSKSHSIITS